ncbi:MAG: hypothetical protein ACYDBQ_05765 [Thermoplasmatota archaeon]
MASRTLAVIGGLLMVAPLVIWGVVTSGSHSWADLAYDFFWMLLVAPLLFIAGLVCLIVGFVGGRSQQQQQQVVVVTGGSALVGASDARGATGRPCPACKTALPAAARFCTACGKGV